MRSRENLWAGSVVVGLGLLLIAAIWIFAPTNAVAQADGEARVLRGETVFGQKCTVCHTIGQGVLVGPDLQGIAETREDSWLKVQIQSPPTSGAMPNLGLTEQQVEDVIAYLKTAGIGSEVMPARHIPNWLFPTLAIGVLAIVGITLIGLIVGTKKVEVRP